jgi:hypothetical protein
MNRRSDLDRVLQVWMADGPAAIPDRVVDVIATRIAVQRQRRAWPFPGRTTVTTQIKLIAALAAAVIVAVVGYNLLPRDGGPGGPSSPPATSAPTATPTASPIPLPEGSLEAGRYRFDLSFVDPGMSLVADIPAGWNGHPDAVALTSADGENDGILLTFMEVPGVFPDPCRWDPDADGEPDPPADADVGPSVADLVAALEANTSYTATAANPVTIGRFPGQRLELQLPGADVISECDRRTDQTTGDFFVFPMGFYAQGADSRWRLTIVDVDGSRLVILVSIVGGAPEADAIAADAIVASFEITP